jgi:AraC family transcriptional regulator
MDVTIAERSALRIAGIRHIGPYQGIGQAFGRLGGMLKGAPPAGAQMVALYHDDPAATAPTQLRSDAALTLPTGVPTPDGLIEQRIPAGRYAVTTHKGPYEGLPATWAALKNDWLTASGHRVGYPSYEIYLNNPTTTKPEDLLTEIYLRLA